MSNRVDLYQPEQTDLAITACGTAVFIDDAVCPELEAIEIVRSAWPDFSSAKVAYNPAGIETLQTQSLEKIRSRFQPGSEVRICRYYNSSPPSVVVETVPIFIGQIVTVDTELSDKSCDIRITAADYSANLERITVFGRYVGDIDGSVKFLSGADTIFNEDAAGNASLSSVKISGRTCPVFAADLSEANCWTYAMIIDYLLSAHLPHDTLVRPDLELLRALTDDQQAAELDVTGLNLLQALNQCCEPTGLCFRFLPVNTPHGTKQAVEFYKPDSTRCVELELQQAGEPLNISRTNIASFSAGRNYWPVTHRYIGLGDKKRFEATFELKPAWDESLENTDFDLFSPSSNEEFYKVRDVYRKWCLNESGRYTDPPYNQGPAFDFSQIFGTEDYVHRPRRFYPALTVDKQGRSLGYFLEVSYDDGQHWWQYLYAFDNLLNECGIWLSSDRLDLNTWIAILKGVLRFRITCSCLSDERLSCEIADGPAGAAAPVVDHLIHLPRPFRYRKVTKQSIFYNSVDPSLGTPDEADDSQQLRQYLRKWAGPKSEVIETVDLQTPYPALYHLPHDRVTTPSQSRDVLGLLNDNRSTARIEQVRIDLRNQCTHLKIIRKRNRQL